MNNEYSDKIFFSLSPIDICWIKTSSKSYLFSTKIRIKIIIWILVCYPGLRPLGAKKTGFNRKIFHFYDRRKLSIIRCDKISITYLLFSVYFLCCPSYVSKYNTITKERRDGSNNKKNIFHVYFVGESLKIN